MQDYNHLAQDYAAHRRPEPTVIAALIASGDVGPATRVLEVGCGTGNYIGAIATETGCSANGVDVSTEMLAFARQRCPGVTLRECPAERIELPGEKLDFVYSVDAIHHFASTRDFFREAARLLAPGGRIASVTHSAALLRVEGVLARYFPETIEANIARYPPLGQLTDEMAAAGFTEIEESVVEFSVVSDGSVYANRADSTLHLISDEAYERGMARLNDDLAEGPVEGMRRYLLITGAKPPGP
jgi:ubiquinone/menaquinone biosynthesis C-methylase UbiE